MEVYISENMPIDQHIYAQNEHTCQWSNTQKDIRDENLDAQTPKQFNP